MNILQSIFGSKKQKVAFPKTWKEAAPLIMPVLSSQESLDSLIAALKKMMDCDRLDLPVVDRLDFFITFVVDFRQTMMTVTYDYLKEWGVGDDLSLLPKTAFANLIDYINRTKTIKVEGMDGLLSFINSTPAPEDEYVASIAAFPQLLGQYVSQMGMTEVYVAFPNRFSIALAKPNDAMKLMLEYAIVDFYDSVPTRKQVSKSIYRFDTGGEMTIVETLSNEQIEELKKTRGGSACA